MMTKSMILVVLVLLPLAAYAAPDILDEYVHQALANNLGLQQRDLSYETARAELAEARGLFLPSLSLRSRYTRAGGGRSIDIPIGDLVNPIHEALNQLIGEPVFPANLKNETTPFLREKEQETKLSLTQSVFQPSIYFNYRIRSRMKSAEQAARNASVQELVRDVKTAYFNYFKAIKVVDLYDQTRDLLAENLRVSQSLFENGKATQDVVYRARAELSQLEQDLAEAQKTSALARSYFNLLLNRPLDSEVMVAEADSIPVAFTGTLPEAQAQALETRYEVQRLQMAMEAARDQVRLSKSAFAPGVVLALDYGFQGEEYRFMEDDDFWTGSLVLEWNLFDGFQREARISQARAQRKKLEAQVQELKETIRLQVKEAYDNIIVARKSIMAARDRLDSAAKSFDIVRKKYAEGMAAQIEYLDARTTMTQAEINLIVTTYDYHIRLAELEHATGSYPIEDR
jgi:outer membrane protein